MADLRALADAFAAKPQPSFDLSRIFFPEQLAFADDPATFVTAATSRRAGKSTGLAGRLLRSAKEQPQAPVLYFTSTRKEAKRIMWEPLLAMNRDHNLGFDPVESDLVLKRNGFARIYLTGCDNQTEVGKMRGSGWGDVAGDEAQLFPSYIKPLVEEVLTPALMDFNGSLRLTGTPGPVPSGFFFDVSQSPTWSHHAWTCWDNPHVRPAGILAKALALRGITESDPGIQREFYGRWVYDPNALVFRWAPGCAFAELPACRAKWQHVVGVDLGFDDADAIAVLAFNDEIPSTYLVEEWVGTKQTITELAERLADVVARRDPLSVVMDTGGLGKKIAEEMRKRHSLPIRAAEKPRKFEFIELLNDALRSGRFFARSDSRFAHDALLVEWDKERSRNDRFVISNRFHSDVCDAVLYAYRESLHWLHEPAVSSPDEGTRAWEDAEEKALAEKLQREDEERRDLDRWMG